MIRTAENLRCRMRLGTVSLGFDNLCHYPAPRAKSDWKLQLTRLENWKQKHSYISMTAAV